jgi:hypothetical protein
MTIPLWQFIQKEHAAMRPRRLPGQGRGPAADQPAIGDGMGGVRNGRAVTNTVRAPVRPATLWMCVVSMVSVRVMTGRVVVSRRASIDFPILEG